MTKKSKLKYFNDLASTENDPKNFQNYQKLIDYNVFEDDFIFRLKLWGERYLV